MNTKSNQSGFSLFEMMIVVAIMAIMISLVAPSLMNQLRKAETVRVTSDLQQIATQSKFYYLDNYTFPSKIEKLVPHYFNTVPTDSWGNPYTIRREKKEYVVFSAGPDGRRGTRDDIIHVINLRGYRNARR